MNAFDNVRAAEARLDAMPNPYRPILTSHGYVRVRFPALWAALGALRLPRTWLVSSGEMPHNAECTDDMCVVRSDR